MANKIEVKPIIEHFYPWPIVLVSCVDQAGKPNLITIGACSVTSAHPPIFGIAVGSKQYSLGLIQATGDFGVNLPDTDQLRATDLCGSLSGRQLNKFERAGFTPQPSSAIKSPLVVECPVSFECKVTHDLPLGDHHWVMGEIVAAHIREDLLDERQRLVHARLKPIFSFWYEYYSIGEKLADWHYAKKEG